ncbi:MAG: hypothetical protein V3S11_03690, partial [Elusimicrobiota bacterium]
MEPVLFEQILNNLLDLIRRTAVECAERQRLRELGLEIEFAQGLMLGGNLPAQAVGFAERLSKKAAGLGLSYGVKFSNTLIVENRPGGFLPASEKERYLSGPPLHVLAMSLVRRFRKRFGDRIPVSFSAG